LGFTVERLEELETLMKRKNELINLREKLKDKLLEGASSRNNNKLQKFIT
jgi:hypothetical protein